MKVGIVFIAIITALCFSSSIAEAISPGWSEPVQITTHWLGDSSSTLIQDKNGTYWVAWRSARELPGDIWISNSTDRITWSVPVMITDNDSRDDMPSLIQDSNGTFWLAFKNSTTGGDQNVWIQNSSDGINWNTPIPIVTDSYKDYWPSLMQDSNGTFWVAWESQDRGANNDIYYATSDDGVNWSAPVNIPTNATYFDYEPDIIEDSNGTYWVVWRCGYGSVDNVCIANSTDGSSWSSPREIVITGEKPVLMQNSTGLYWLAMNRLIGGNRDIYFSTSTNGTDWSTARQITINTSDERNPSIIKDSNGTIWVAYESDRSGRDIYITHSTVTLTTPLGGEVWNGTRNITWASVSGDYQNDTFSLYYSTDGASWTLINSSIPADGAYTNKSYEWNTSNVSDSGNYTIKIIRVHPLHNESNISGVFSINNVDTEPPEVTGIVPADGSYVGGMQYINVTVVDVLSGVGFVVANISNATWSSVYVLSSGSGSVWYNDSWDTAELAEGSYNISINATDTLEYSNDTEYVTVTVDNTLPGITIASPANTTYSVSSVALNYSVSEPVSWEAYSLDGEANQTGGNQTLSGLSNGNHNITVWSNDTAGNMNSSTVYFSVDVKEANTPSDGGYVWRPKMVLLANSIDYNLSSNFTAFLKNRGVDVIYTTPESFPDYNTNRFIVILGGPDACEGVGEIIREVLNETEQTEVRAKGSEKLYIKDSVWTSWQRVFILAGSDRWGTKEACIDNMETVKTNLR